MSSRCLSYFILYCLATLIRRADVWAQFWSLAHPSCQARKKKKKSFLRQCWRCNKLPFKSHRRQSVKCTCERASGSLAIAKEIRDISDIKKREGGESVFTSLPTGFGKSCCIADSLGGAPMRSPGAKWAKRIKSNWSNLNATQLVHPTFNIFIQSFFEIFNPAQQFIRFSNV